MPTYDLAIVRERVRNLIANETLAGACRRLGLHREQVLRLASGADCRQGTALTAAVVLGLTSIAEAANP
jgi:hypothetical protein